MIITKSNQTYFINERAISFTENDLDSPNRVGVSIESSTVIMVHMPGTIDFAADGNYQRWTLKAFSTKLATNNPYYLYARLERDSPLGMLVFSVNHYTTTGEIIVSVNPDGSYTTNGTPNESYYYILIGSLTGTDGTTLRELTYDSGLLGTKKAEQAAATKLEEMFELNKNSSPWLIEVKELFRRFSVKESITLLGSLIFGNKTIKGVDSSDNISNPTDDKLATSQYVASYGEHKYLRKDIPDTAADVITFDKGVKYGKYEEGVLGSGGAVIVDESGNTTAEFDFLSIRKKATFTTVTIQELKHVGGSLVLSPAAMTISMVEVLESGDFKCYFEKSNNEQTITNDFKVNDLARCQTFNLTTNRYYWRKVIKVGEDYIVLSSQEGEYDTKSNAPQAGDNLSQLGNIDNSERQNATILSAYGQDAPSFKQYQGINTFSLEDKCITKLTSQGNELTGVLRIQQGSTGWDAFEGLPQAISDAGEFGKQAQEAAKQAQEAANAAQDKADAAADAATQAKADAGEAAEKAEAANDTANAARDRLTSWASDAVISPTEKQSIKDEISRIDADKTDITNEYARYSLGEPTVFNSAYTAYYDQLVLLSQDRDENNNENITIPSDFKANQSGYYVARTTALEQISIAAKKVSDDAQDAADKAQQDAVDAQNRADEALSGLLSLECGKGNLLRNTGFFGDYVTAGLSGNTILDSTSEMYSPSLNYWNPNKATAQDSDISESGKEVVIQDTGTLSQALYFKVLPQEEYIFSFRAKGVDNSQLLFSVGGYSESVALTREWTSYSCKFSAVESGNVFTIVATQECTLCELQLERGNVRSAWSTSPLDNRSDLARYESLTYLADVIQNGSTTTNGGLINTGFINMGMFNEKKEMTRVTAGISGVCNDDNSVAYWAGGTFEEANYAVSTYANNPNKIPTDEELVQMAKYVVTHGGRAILNDIILRGYVYALGGVFKGQISIADGKILLNADGSGELADGKIAWDKEGNIKRITTAMGGQRIEIDPETNGLVLYNESGDKVARLDFSKVDGVLLSRLELTRYVDNKAIYSTSVSDASISTYNYTTQSHSMLSGCIISSGKREGDIGYSVEVHPEKGITFQQIDYDKGTIKTTKTYPAS